jgi:hypothetical protein
MHNLTPEERRFVMEILRQAALGNALLAYQSAVTYPGQSAHARGLAEKALAIAAKIERTT